jgi:hypothetical protein
MNFSKTGRGFLISQMEPGAGAGAGVGSLGLRGFRCDEPNFG